MAEAVVSDRRHAATLVPAVREVLRLGGVGFGDLAGIVVADGPGSFTGLRIGFATAKGLVRQFDELELRTVPSLMATAWQAHPFTPGAVAAMYDALRGEVFAAVYDFSGAAVRVVQEPLRTTVAEVMQRCPTPPGLAVGDGAVAHAALIEQWTGRPAVGPPVGAPRASALLELLAVTGATAVAADPSELEPVYGRLAEAQARWERAHGRRLPDPDRSAR